MEKNVDDIVAMLDAFMAKGGGHMNLEFNDGDQIEVKNGVDSCKGTACQVPTFHFDEEMDDQF